jgi:chemotaxis protein MotB
MLLLSTALLSACGVKKEVHQKALDTLATCQGELQAARKLAAQRAARINELETETNNERSAKEALQKAGKATEKELEELRKQREAAEKRLTAYRALQEKFRKLADTGKLKVDFRNGQMVLKLPSGVLFPSGQAKLSDTGKTALGEILSILLEFRDRRFMVAGHTDNVPIKSRHFRNNWALSTARAVSVVEFMIDAGFDPTQVAATGYGEFDPVAPNDSEDGKQLNRRIEIILVPDLSELPNLASEPAAS